MVVMTVVVVMMMMVVMMMKACVKRTWAPSGHLLALSVVCLSVCLFLKSMEKF